MPESIESDKNSNLDVSSNDKSKLDVSFITNNGPVIIVIVLILIIISVNYYKVESGEKKTVKKEKNENKEWNLKELEKTVKIINSAQQ